MARFSALTLLVTVFYFLVCATQVSAPWHSDISLQTIEIIPEVLPILTISAPPPPTHSPCAGINRCDKSPVYGTWASRFVNSFNQAREHLDVRSTIRPYFSQLGHYVYQVVDFLTHPDPGMSLGLVMLPTTGKLAALPTNWSHVEVAPAAHVPPPPPPPTHALPVCFPATGTIGPLNPANPSVGHLRRRYTELIVEMDTNSDSNSNSDSGSDLGLDSDDWIHRMICTNSTLLLVITSFWWRFKKALDSVKRVEDRNSANGGVVSSCNTTRSAVPQSSSAIVKTSNQPLDLVLWRAPVFVPNFTMTLTLTPNSFNGLPSALRSQLTLTLRQLIPSNNTLISVNQTGLLPPFVPTGRRTPLLIEWHSTTTDQRPEASNLFIGMNDLLTSMVQAATATPRTASTPSNILTISHSDTPTISSPPSGLVIRPRLGEFGYQSTDRITEVRETTTTDVLTTLASPFNTPPHEASRPILIQPSRTQAIDTIGRRIQSLVQPRPEPRVNVPLPSTQTVVGPLPLGNSRPASNHSRTTPTTPTTPTQRPYHTFRLSITPSFEPGKGYSPPRLIIERKTWSPTTKISDDEVAPELPVSTPTSTIKPDSLPRPKLSPPLPASFHRYAKIRLNDLSAYPPEKRDEILRREIRLAEGRHQLEKSRRAHERFSNRLTRAEMDQRGERVSKRQKCKEQVEEEKEMKRVLAARRRGEEEVFKGKGGPPQPSDYWMAKWVYALECDSPPTKEKGKEKKKGKGVRWADEAGGNLVEWKEFGKDEVIVEKKAVAPEWMVKWFEQIKRDNAASKVRSAAKGNKE